MNDTTAQPAKPGDRVVEVKFLVSIPLTEFTDDFDDTLGDLLGEVESAIQRTRLSYAHLTATIVPATTAGPGTTGGDQ